MAKSKYTPFEQNDIKLSKWLVDCDAKLAAVQASLAGAEKTHRAPLRKLFKELTQAHTKKTESLAQNTYDLEWEANILRPLTLHLNDVGQAWTNQHYCKEALDYFVQLAKIGDDMVKLYSQNSPIEKMKERVEAFMDAAPMTLGMAEEPSPYYPLMTKRRDVSELLWQEILSELSPQKNKT
jgi:rubrerythrin